MFYLKRDTRATKGHAPESAATKTTHTLTDSVRDRETDRRTDRTNTDDISCAVIEGRDSVRSKIPKI